MDEEDLILSIFCGNKIVQEMKASKFHFFEGELLSVSWCDWLLTYPSGVDCNSPAIGSLLSRH